jgi:hypothetical protein
MKRICPNPLPWHEVFEGLTKFAQLHPCAPPTPPKPLILAGWAYSNDVEKMQRWEETVDWAVKNGCADLVSGIPDSDFYFTENPTSYMVGPLSGPMYRPWDFQAKSCPPSDKIAQLMDTLLSRWSEIVGIELANVTSPLAFTGKKGRRLLVLGNAAVTPPWGSWSRLSTHESARRPFTYFRAAINKAIAPHEVDHIDLKTESNAEQSAPADAPETART